MDYNDAPGVLIKGAFLFIKKIFGGFDNVCTFTVMDTVIKSKNIVIISDIDVKVVEALSHGKKASEVPKAIKYKVSHRTVEARIEKLKLKYNCRNTAHLVASFLRNGLIK